MPACRLCAFPWQMEPRMLIRLGYDIQFEIPAAVAMVGMLHVHPSRAADLREPDEVTISPT